MAKSYMSPGVGYNEIEESLSRLESYSPVITIIGGAHKGPLTPTMITSQKRLNDIFGSPDENDFGVYAAEYILREPCSVVYRRVVGSGAKKGTCGDPAVDLFTFETKEFDSELEGAEVGLRFNGDKVSIDLKKGKRVLENYPNLSLNENDRTFVTKIMQSAGSRLNVTYNKELLKGVERIEAVKDSSVDLTSGDGTLVLVGDSLTGETGLGSVTFEDLGSVDISTENTNIAVSGNLNKVDWPEFSSILADRLGYYVTLPLTGEKGAYIGKTTKTGNWKVLSLEACEEGWVVAIEKGTDGFYFYAFDTEEDARKKTNGTEYYVDLSEVIYEDEDNKDLFEDTILTIRGSNNGIDSITADDYMNAVDDFSNPEVISVSTLIIPGISDINVIKHTVEMVETRGDAMYIPDVPFGLDAQGILDFVNSPEQNDNWKFESIFTAVYGPWVKVQNTAKTKQYWMPPSAIVGRVFCQSDNVSAGPWIAAAGFGKNRGVVKDAVGIEFNLTKGERDQWQGNGNVVNPISFFMGMGIAVFGNKTCKRVYEYDEVTPFTEVHIRRLANYVKSQIINISLTELFNPNDSSTWSTWTMKVEDVLEDIKIKDGLEKYRVFMDDSTVSPDDIANGQAPGMIYIKPIHALEYIEITFVVTENDVEFGEETETGSLEDNFVEV